MQVLEDYGGVQTRSTLYVSSWDLRDEGKVLQLREFLTPSSGVHREDLIYFNLYPGTTGGSYRRWLTTEEGVEGEGCSSKPVAKDSPGDAQKGKAANGGEMKPKEVASGLSGATSEGTQGGESSTTEPMGEPSTEAAAELMREATSLLKSIRSLKAVRMKSIGEGNFGGPGEYALLDGGATHGLRQAKPEEEPDLIATKVELACGSTVLYKHPKHQTLLSKEPVEPIIPLAWLVAADYRITWRRDSIVIHHPVRGPLKCSLRGGCPVMSRSEGLELLADLEKMQQTNIEVKEDELNWWASQFPQVPTSVWKFMKGQGESWKDHAVGLPWNRHRRRRLWRCRRVILHLFSGRNPKHWAELEQAGYMVITVDTLQGVDLHDAATWAFLWELACAGKIAAILGGPPCRTTSRLRQRQPGPPPLRGRDEWRFSLEGLTTWDLHRVNSDTALLFKQLGLFIKAEEKRLQVLELQSLPTAFALESPEDPMAYLGVEAAHNLPSFWNFPELKEMVGLGNLRLVSFDQSQMGHARRKPTTILGNLPGLEQLDGLRDSSRRSDPLPRGLQESMEASKDWASWAPGLVMALKEALKVYLSQRDQCLAQRIHKLNVEEWKQHVKAHHHPYRRDCRRCMELAGVDSPHRRSHADSSAYVLSMDLVGPYPVGRDDGRRRNGKYIMVATVPLPMLERDDLSEDQKVDRDDEKIETDGKEANESLNSHADGEPGAPQDPPRPEEGASLEEVDEEHDVEMVNEEAANSLNQAWMEYIDGLKGPVGLQNITLVEILESRHIAHIVEATSRVYGRFRALGVPILRVHTDREKSFLSKPFQRWCSSHSLYQTMTSGDDGPANGRVEAEVGQIKRRLRVLLATSKLELQDWPGVARWAGEERLRKQLQKVGVPSKPMVPLGERVVVKTKRWHKQGPLAAPFKSMVLMGPSPNMTNGCVLRDGRKVQHARAVVRPAEAGEKAVMELYDASTRRVTGKQPSYLEDRKVPQPLQHDDLPQLLREDLALDDSHDVWGEAGNADLGEDVLSLGYSPDDFPDELHGDQPHDGDQDGSVDVEPALRTMWAGGESNPTSKATSKTMVDPNSPNASVATISTAFSATLSACESCGLMQPDGEDCNFCAGPTSRQRSSQSGLASLSMKASSQSGLASMSMKVSSRSGSIGRFGSEDVEHQAELGPEGGRAWDSVEVPDLAGLVDSIHREHWGWKKLWEQELSREAVGAETGFVHGQCLQYLEGQVKSLEEELALVSGSTLKQEAVECRLAALSKDVDGVLEEPLCPDPPDQARAVLQTYTVSLTEVKKDINLWKEPLQPEMEALVSSGTIRRVRVDQLVEEPGYDKMEVAPAKIVPTIKSPSGKRKARLVICGNMVHPAGHVKPSQLPDGGDHGCHRPRGVASPAVQSPGDGKDPNGGGVGKPGGDGPAAATDLYAGGVDSTALRCVLRKAAGASWSLASTDVRGAFLLAPRSQTRRQLLVVEPPRLLTSTGLIPTEERWICDGAMYGLDTSPADWASFRDHRMSSFRWETPTHRCRLSRSPEPNIWSIMGVCKTKHPEPVLNDDAHADPLGFLIVYVDDILCVGPRPVVEASLGRIRDEWTCSEVEWVNSAKWLKFCGMQLRWQEDSLLLGQPDFARELLERHGPVPGRQVPLPKIDMVPDVEDSIDPADVRKCQQLLGELLWLSGRTRPDLAFAVSTLSGWVTKCPKKVQELGRYLLGYLQETWEFVLVYKSCLTDQGEPTDELMKLTLLSDASHAPQGLRGCQGILALWGGALVQWESKRQPFAALSSTEAELIGYVDALTMGESLQVILNILEHNALVDDGQFEIRGDNLSGIQLLLAPDGPWCTRHLRLRSFVLRERLASREWHVEHVPGAELAADLLTKPVVLLNNWESFRRTLGLIKFSMPDETSRLCRLAEAVVALGGLVLQNGASQLVKTAGAVSLSALTAWMCCHEGLASMANMKKENCEPRPAQEHHKRPREHEPGPTESSINDYATHCSLIGSPAVTPRLCALGGHAMAGGAPQGPWNSVEFQGMPTGNSDRWRSLVGGWYCRVHGGLRSRLFHPVHTSTPVRPEDLEAERVTVVWHCPGGRPWTRMIHQDFWGLGGQPIPGVEQWKGYTFFRVREGNQSGGNSSGLPRIRPDIVVWGDEDPLPPMAKQGGMSSAYPPPGAGAGATPAPKADGYRQPTPKTGRYQAPTGASGDLPRGRPGPGHRGKAAMGIGAGPISPVEEGRMTAAGRTTMGAGPMGTIPVGAVGADGAEGGGNPLLASLAMRPPEMNPGGPASSSSLVIPGEWSTGGNPPGLVTPRGSVAGAWARQPGLVVKALGTPYQAERRLDPAPEGLEEEEEEDFQEEALESEIPSEDEYTLVSDGDSNHGATPDNEEEDMWVPGFSLGTQRRLDQFCP